MYKYYFSKDNLLKYGKHYRGSLALADTELLMYWPKGNEDPVSPDDFMTLVTLRQRIFKTIKGN